MERSPQGAEHVSQVDSGLNEQGDKNFNHSGETIERTQLSWQNCLASILNPEESRAHETTQLGAITTEAETFDPLFFDLYSGAADVGHHIDEWLARTLHDFEDFETSQTPLEEVHTFRNRLDPRDGDLKCFGVIYASIVRLIGNMQDLKTKMTGLPLTETTLRLDLDFRSSSVLLTLDHEIEIAQVNDQMARCLICLSEIPSIHFEAILKVQDTLQCIDKAKRPHEAQIAVDITVKGSLGFRQQIGDLLAKHKTYLQHNIHDKNYLARDNPHMLTFDDIDSTNDHSSLADNTPEQMSAVAVQANIKEICLGETHDRDFVGLRDPETSIAIKTKLFSHQEQAIEFMAQREGGTMSEPDQLWQQIDDDDVRVYQHAITGFQTGTKPPDISGGILADDMGMGKTLSVLGLIMLRSSEGLIWSRTMCAASSESEFCQHRSRATLIVAWSLLVMNGWLEEIKNHVNSPLKIVKYHGKNRKRHIERVRDCDIVLTTFHTLAAERQQKNSPLKSIEWFRVVLDEAHTIRRQSTTLFAAVSELETPHRWCLTGTPIQNSLTDLGSLLTFLRMYPLDRHSVFRKYIMNPFSTDIKQATARLKMLLNAVCLRRRIERLHLPPIEAKSRYIEMTEEEKLHYDQTLHSMSYAASYRSRKHYADNPFGRFQIQLHLRILCNHGTFQKPFDWSHNDRQTQKEEAVCSMGVNGEVTCSCCYQKVLALGTDWTADCQALSGGGVVCEECFTSLVNERGALSAAGLVGSVNSHVEGTNPGDLPYRVRPSPRSFSAKFNVTGHSSKMIALMEDLMNGLTTTKSMIFSCWTESLNLVAWHLEKRKVTFVQIDGTVEVSRRQTILDRFAIENEIRVLLMTTGTGAYGLNLAVANRVFVLEPQWNPSVESQAIARVQRFPQNQRVQVMRYVVRGTVEEDIRRQQKGKSDLADRGFVQGDMS